MRRSEWRPLRDDPRSPLAWWWREAWPLLALVVAFVLTSGLVLRLAFLFGGLQLGAAVAPFAALCGARALLLRRREHPGLSALAPSPAPAEAFPVEIRLSTEGVVTGRDQGVASFVDGWVHVEGLRASLSLRPLDVARAGVAPGGWERFDLPGGQRIEVRPLSPSAADRDTFAETVRVWHRFTVAPPPGEPLLPPLAVHPSAASPALTRLAGALATALFFVGMVGALASIPHATVLATFMGLYGAYCVLGSGGRAVRDLRRLNRVYRKALADGA